MGFRKENEKCLFYVPKSMRSEVLKPCHDDVGHVGVEKVRELVMRSYCFLNMKQTIRDYVKNCLKYMTYSKNAGKSEGILHPIPKGDVPFDTIHHHYGPLEKTPALLNLLSYFHVVLLTLKKLLNT